MAGQAKLLAPAGNPPAPQRLEPRSPERSHRGVGVVYPPSPQLLVLLERETPPVLSDAVRVRELAAGRDSLVQGGWCGSSDVVVELVTPHVYDCSLVHLATSGRALSRSIRYSTPLQSQVRPASPRLRSVLSRTFQRLQ